MLTAEIDLRYLETQHGRGRLTVAECLEFCRELVAELTARDEDEEYTREELDGEIESLRADLAEEREANRQGAAGAALLREVGRRDAAAAQVARAAGGGLERAALAMDAAALVLAGDRITQATKDRTRRALLDAAAAARKTRQEIDIVRQEAEREGDGAGADPGVTPAAGVVPAVGAGTERLLSADG